MLAPPVVRFTPKEWRAAIATFQTLDPVGRGPRGLNYTTIEIVACVSGVSKQVARRALRKLVAAGVVRQRGAWPIQFRPAIW